MHFPTPGEAQFDENNESFWPSFTDIMMVIVMIFLLVSVALIIHNEQLAIDLLNTKESEQLVIEQFSTAQEENQTLEERLANLEYRLSLASMQLLRAKEDEQALQDELQQQRQALFKAQQQSQQQTATTQSLAAQLRSQEETHAQKLADLERLQTQQQQALTTLQADLVQEKQAKAEALQQIKVQTEENERQYSALEKEYKELDAKYQKLIRPARSAKDKQVVEVRYEKRNGKPLIRYRESQRGKYEVLSREKMHEKLAAMKAQYGDKLYVKVVIPESSGLSYSEAWKFTRDTLHRYDYYYENAESKKAAEE